MVYIDTDIPEIAAELAEEIRLFIDERHILPYDEKAEEGSYIIRLKTELAEDKWKNTCMLIKDGVQLSEYSALTDAADEKDILLYKKLRKHGAKAAVYRCLKKYFDIEQPWGSLTGVRPTKLYREMSKTDGEDCAKRRLADDYDVSEKKLELLERIHAVQKPIIDSVAERDIDIYVGIPFCVSRCAYCSFASSLTSRNGDAERRYVEALLREMDYVERILDERNVRCVYFGGGTPTALQPEELERLIRRVMRYGAIEFTVEAGRPDTLSDETFAMLRENGVGRISVNAQTTSNDTLKLIGRSHCAEDFFAAFEKARSYGFDFINTDVIAGLPGEDTEVFAKTMRDVAALAPENITVHTLAIKRASDFGKANSGKFASRDEAGRMLETADEILGQGGYAPYYMYRQKYMTGNMENTGYSIPGKECIYNVDIMEETADILAFGAGAISKRLFADENRLERAAGVKDIAMYVERIDEMAKRKIDLFCG